MEEQSYTIYRDFRSWTGALILRLRDNRSGSDDVTVAFTFSLKAAPRFGIGKDSFGRIPSWVVDLSLNLTLCRLDFEGLHPIRPLGPHTAM